MTLMTVCNGKSSEPVSDFHIIIICEIICRSLDNEVLDGPINSGIDVRRLDIGVNCHANGSWLKVSQKKVRKLVIGEFISTS